MSILVSDKVYAEAVSKGRSVNEQLAIEYEGEIADKVKSNQNFEKLTPVQLAMVDAGLTNKSIVKDFYTTTGNEYLFPALVEIKVQETLNGNQMLNGLIASTRTVNSRDVRTIKYDFSTEAATKALAKRDVAEGASLPEVMIKESSKNISMFKRGVAVTSTYEAIQFAPVNMFLETLAEVNKFTPYQQLGDAIDVLVNGDGNDNAAIATDVVATTGTLAADDLITFLINFTIANKMNMTIDTLIVAPDLLKALASMYVSTNQANSYRPGTTLNFPQVDLSNLTIWCDPRVPQIGGKDILIGINKAAALDKYSVANSIINEFDRDIRSQKQIGTISEYSGFGKRNNNATRILKMK